MDNVKLCELISSIDMFHAIRLCLEKGVFEIDDQGETVALLAGRIGLTLHKTQALINAGAHLGALKQEQDIVHLTTSGKRYLTKDSPFYMGGIIQWLPLDYAMFKRSFEGQHPDVFGMNEEMCRLMVGMMHQKSAGLANYWPSQVDLSKSEVLLDVGAGSGIHVIEACRRFENLRGIALDLPWSCRVTEEFLGRYGMNERVLLYPADMFTGSWPKADVILMCDILHDWGDDRVDALLQKARATLPSGGRIILLETLLDDDGAGPFVAVAFNLSVVKMLENGGQRTSQRFREMLQAAGFGEISIQPTLSGASLIQATTP